MDIHTLQKTLSNPYRSDADRIKRHAQQAYHKVADCPQGDSAEISEEGRRALQEKMSAYKAWKTEDLQKPSALDSGIYGIMSDFERILSELGGGSVSDAFVTENYSQEKVDELKTRFEREQKGTRTDTFDCYVNKMASAYQLMRERIEEKYASSDRQKEYYLAEDGSAQELTREKELEMLDKVYDTHSRFMAASTQIWSELQRFQARTVYDSRAEETEAPVVNRRHKDIKEQAYHAFLSAITESNRELLKQEKGSLNHFYLHLGISSAERKTLNGIWDYYANK